MKNLDAGLNLKITGDAAELKKAMAASTESIAKLEKRAQDSSKAMAEGLRQVEYFKRQAEATGDVKAFAKDLAAAKKEVVAAEKALNGTNAKLRSARDHAARLGEAYTAAARAEAEADARSAAAEAAAAAAMQRQLAAKQRVIDLEGKLSGLVYARAQREAIAENARRDAEAAATRAAATRLASDRAAIRAGLAASNTVSGANGAARQTLGLPDHRDIAARINAVHLAYERLRASGTLTATELAQAHHRQKEIVRGLAEQMNGATVMQDRMNRAMGVFNAGIAAFATLAPAMRVVKIADDMKLLEARVKLVSASSGEARAAMAGIFEVAARAQAPVEAVGASYVKFANAIRALGGTQLESLRFTEAVALGLRVSGASATEAGSAMMQLAQAMQSGKLSGDEFRSVNENGGKLLDYLAKQMGVTRGELALMAEEGKLTSDVLRENLPAALEQIRADAEKLPQTVGSAMQNLSNEFARWVHESEMVNRISGGLAETVGFLAENMDALMNLGIAASVIGMAAAFMRLRQAILLTRAAGISLMAANPWLLAFAAITTGIAIFYGIGAAAEEAGDTASDAADKTRERYEELNDRLVHLAERRTSLERKVAEAAQAAQMDILEGQKKSISEQIEGAKRLGSELVEAYKKAGDAAEAAKKKAADLRQSITDRRGDRQAKAQDRNLTALDKSDPAAAETARQVAANEALTAAEMANARAVEARYAGNADAAAKYAAAQDKAIARAEQLAGAIRNEALAQQLLDAAANAADRNLAEQAAMEDAKAAKATEQQQSIAAQMAANTQELAALAALEEQIKALSGEKEAIKIAADQQALEKVKSDIEAVRAELAKIPPEVRTKIVVERMSADALPAKATGGLITGPGTGTSDSILARLSNGEFIMRAAAVQRWGVDRLAALNAGRLPQFAGGGLVTRAVAASLPRYAEGGLVRPAAAAALQPIHIHLGGRSYPLQADPAVAQDFAAALRREALRHTG